MQMRLKTVKCIHARLLYERKHADNEGSICAKIERNMQNLQL